jgi:hypothetical protein
MAKAPPILVMMLIVRFKYFLKILLNLLSRVGVIRLGFFFLQAAWFQLQLSGITRKPERSMVNLPDSGEKTLDLACASVARAELTASARQMGELWYQIQSTPESKTLESIQDLFAVVFLSARTKAVSIVLAGQPSDPFRDLGLATVIGDEAAESPGSVTLLMDSRNSPSLAAVLTKPFYLSEIAPNDYLKRASNGRKVVLVSISESNFSECWLQILGNTRRLFGADAGSLFILVDRSSIPQGKGLPPGLIVQSLEILGFTGLERMGLARNVDFLVTDHAPYILSALARNPTIVSPVFHEKGRPIAGGSRQGMWFDISRLAEGGRELERCRVTDDVPVQQGKSDSV